MPPSLELSRGGQRHLGNPGGDRGLRHARVDRCGAGHRAGLAAAREARSRTIERMTPPHPTDPLRAPALGRSGPTGRASATRPSRPRTPAGTRSGRGTTCSRSSGRGSSRSSRAGASSPARPPLTRRVRLGLMVGANTFRNPGLTAKLATTLDHLSDGRAVLGIGGAWFEREHDAYGIDFREPRRTARPARRVGHAHPPPARRGAVQPRGPVLHVPRRAVRAAAGPGAPADPRRWVRAEEDAADGRAAGGRLEHERARSTRSRANLDILGEHCADVGRDLATIEKTVSFPIVLDDDRAAAPSRYRALMAHNGVDRMEMAPLLGAPTEVADALRPYRASASRPSSCGCRRRTTARRSTACHGSRELLDA